jgi:hypothetical protein
MKKKTYSPPALRKVTIDKEISMVMMSDPPGDPGAGIMPKGLNPLQWLR